VVVVVVGECGEWWTTGRLWKENTKDVKDKNIQLTYIAIRMKY
jgi:hypothetical protein